jgi:hypothetical protein
MVVVGTELALELPLFFYAFAVDLVCAITIDPVIRKALIQKLAANFRYRLIGFLSSNFFSTASSTLTPVRLVDTTSALPCLSSCDPSPAVIQTMYSSLLRQI